MSQFTYIARCKDDSLYIGVTGDLAKRLDCHNRGAGSRWVAQHGGASIVYSEEYPDYLLAHRRELQLKKWSRAKKEALIEGRL